MASAAALGVGGFDDRPADHEVVGAGGDRAGRRHHPLLVARRGAGRADAGGDQRHRGADEGAQRGRLFGRTDEPVDADLARLRRPPRDQRRDAERVSGRLEVRIVVGGEHGHGENAQAGAASRGDRGLHGLRIGVHGDEGRADAGDALHALFDGVADVVQLEVEEHLLAGADQRFRERHAAGEGELIADLVERDGIAEPLDEGSGRRNGRDIEGDDQPVARCGHQFSTCWA